MSELNITEITLDNFSETVTKYISDKGLKITDIDSMIETYLSMLGDHYLFKFDRDLLKDMLVDLTYMYSPNDDANKDRVLYHLVGSDSDDDDSEDGEDMMKKLTEQLMSQMPINTNIEESVPEESVPEESVPEESVPEESVPENMYASEGQ